MKAKILRVAVPSPLYRCFDYLAPEHAESLRPGMRVRVPFGNRYSIGVLLELREDTPVPAKTLRPILAVLDTEPVLPDELLTLSCWAQRYYHHPPGEVFMTLLPVLLRQGQAARCKALLLWQLTTAGHTALANDVPRRAQRQRELLEYLAQYPRGVSNEQLRSVMPAGSDIARVLRNKGWLEQVAVVPRPARQIASRPQLNAAQLAAVKAACGALGSFTVFLLDGVTGSGKTEVYLRIVEAVLAQKRQALVLVPEIGLTPQLLERFMTRFPTPIAVLHSGLSHQERLNAWLLARDGTASVVIGTRSAIFTPIKNLGVIIVDEEHDISFKQQEGFRYHARDLAIMRAHQATVPVLLGSATPSLESLFNVQRGRYQRLCLPNRVGNAVSPPIEVLDVRHQPMEEGLSIPLLRRIHTHLAQQGQVLLFLNRRGFAPTLICHECGWIGQCQRCDARLTLHLQRRRLICHHCGTEKSIDVACPVCGSVDLRALGQGTERIEQLLKREFPAVGIARIDRDSTRRKGSLQALLKDIYNGERSILIGTQMLAKGHHFPNVTLVGILDADQGLFGADFRTSERMAQLIVQVAGRAGRAEKPGTVIVQTHHPQNPLLQTLICEGYSAFATAALLERQDAELPPFTCQALLRADAIGPELPRAFLAQASASGNSLRRDVELFGPVPAPMERRAGRYRAQLLVQAQRRQQLHEFLNEWMKQLENLKLARKVRWSIDVDPQDLL